MIRALRRGLGAALLAVSLWSGAGAQTGPETTLRILEFSELADWDLDNHVEALRVFRQTCMDMDGADWQSLCALAQNADDGGARSFFELFFRPVLIEDGKAGLFTGYFEPVLRGSRVPSGPYRYPVYRMPPEASQTDLWYTRREILTSGVMQGRGLEIAWVDDPVELFFLQIQGSGRIKLTDGTTIRLGYGGANGHPYRSIGQELARRGVFGLHQVSAQVIRNWVRRNPEAGAELLMHNPSYVFFREVSRVAAHLGPLGAMNRSITPLRSVAVDPAFTPLGAPVWIEKNGANQMHRLMVAQDTGSAIKGAQRADIFFGAGDAAGIEAGQLKDPGRMMVLMPIQRAYALLRDAY